MSLTSPGPITIEGKAIAARNSIRHGLRAESIVIPSEDESQWRQHVDDIVESLDPDGPVEHALALRAAEMLWRLRRASRAERDATTRLHVHHLSMAGRADATAQGSYESNSPALPNPRVLDSIVRYEAHLNRQLYQALHELEAFRDRKLGLAAPLARVEVNATREPSP